MSYQWDVFISYRRADPIEGWVQRILKPEIARWLHGHGGVSEPRIFLDTDARPEASSSEWPQHLRDALATSKVIVPVLSPEYFTSRWCLAELLNMRRRERDTGRRVVYAVQFSDGDFYPEEHRGLSWRPFERYTRYRRPSQLPSSFIAEVQALCKELGTCCDRAPDFNPTWSMEIDLPKVVESPRRLPRFRDE